MFSLVQSLDRLGRRTDMRDDSAEILFSAGGPCEQFWHGQRCPLFYVDHPAFLLPTTTLPALTGAMKRTVLERLLWLVTWPNHVPEEDPVDPQAS